MLGLGCAATYVALNYHSPWQWLFVGTVSLLLFNGIQVSRRQEAMQLDPLLKQMAMSTLLFTVLFRVGQYSEYR
jgi:1,4-dihydroxy-2-naphthoate octaprenyltransferase